MIKDFEEFMMRTVQVGTSNNYPLLIESGVKMGSIQISTSNNFNGTTDTLALKVSNDGSNWGDAFAEDDITILSYTLSTGDNQYFWQLKRVMYKYYMIVYTKGNASVGSISAIFFGKK